MEATKFTEVGFHGQDVDKIIKDLVEVRLRVSYCIWHFSVFRILEGCVRYHLPLVFVLVKNARNSLGFIEIGVCLGIGGRKICCFYYGQDPELGLSGEVECHFSVLLSVLASIGPTLLYDVVFMFVHVFHVFSCLFMFVHFCSCFFMYVHVCSCLFVFVFRWAST